MFFKVFSMNDMFLKFYYITKIRGFYQEVLLPCFF